VEALPLQLVFMLEEESAMHLLEQLLPGILPANVTHLCIPQQGKSDLQKSIPRKLQSWLRPNTRFVILHDQDNHPDCKALKKKLQGLCLSGGHTPLIRIVCRELEAWYFGDLDALQQAFPGFRASQYRGKPKLRDPDKIDNPGEYLKRIVKGFDKGKAARTVPRYMDIDSNTSGSFQQTITGIRRLAEAHAHTKN